MLIPNTTIWHTRIQNVDALVTAAGARGVEIYRLATVCPVGLEPALMSISPNPEYPICAAIDAAGYFGLNFVAEEQAQLVARFYSLPREHPDKLGLLGVQAPPTERGTPLLLDCIHALELEVQHAQNFGDHRTYVGRVVSRRPGTFQGSRTHRFGGPTPPGRRWLKAVACRSGLYDLLIRAKHLARPPAGIAEGTRRHVPTAAPASSSAPRAGDQPGICLVGCGWWGGVHALVLKQQGSRIRRYFTSRTPDRARDFARRFDGKAFERLEEALADPGVTAMVIALPHDAQPEVAERALRAGKHVLLEKPIAIDVAAAERVVRAAQESGRVLAVAEEYRLSPLVRAAHRAIKEGLLGRVTLVQVSAAGPHRPPQDWKNRRATMGGGVLIDVGVHYVDILRSWFGEPDLVWAAYPPHLNDRFEGEDSVLATLRFEAGPVASIALSWSSYRSPRAPQIEIIGERGSLELRFDRPFLVHTTQLPGGHWSGRLREVLPWRVASRLNQFLPRSREARIAVPDRDLIGSEALIADFIEAIESGRPPAVPGSEGLRDLQVVLAAYAAAAAGAPVALAPA
jgi:predicted dehydrogenase/flavin reductase (DIM6/NTAB) family NADH-FMN oxidoreductase RutF